ncbi:MAG: hypothetical protein FJW99_01940 [Actinobacteria bacterium]|nr:hypothetical protein [Actinomycetota bacterium]MBM3697795.1 hypothetical protein [Actinomycetota bacterium]
MTRTSLHAAVAAGLVEGALTAASAVAAPVTITPGTLTICTYPGFAPFTSSASNGAWVGWDASLLTKFAAQRGLTVKPVPVDPFDGM